MYQTILGLPFFKGLEDESISRFIEKVPVQFYNYADGEILIQCGSRCEGLTFVINGKVCVSIQGNIPFRLKYTRRNGIVFGADYIYGLSRDYPFEVRAKNDVSVLYVSKEDFLWFINNNEIAMLNYLNYLCWHSQRPLDSIKIISQANLLNMLRQWVALYTEPDAMEIYVEGESQVLSAACGLSEREYAAEAEDLRAKGLLTIFPHGIAITSRAALSDTLD